MSLGSSWCEGKPNAGSHDLKDSHYGKYIVLSLESRTRVAEPLDCKTVTFFSRFSVVLSLRYWCVTQEFVMHESREATQGEKFLASLSSPTHDFHARSGSFMIQFQPKRHTLKYRLFCSLQSHESERQTHEVASRERACYDHTSCSTHSLKPLMRETPKESLLAG